MSSSTSEQPGHRAWIRHARLQSDEADLAAADTRNSADTAGAAVLAPDYFPGYELQHEIHRGAQGVVFRAVQLSTRRQVALKVLRDGPFTGPADRARFEREVQALAQLRHPDIVAIHDSGQAAGHFYLVMDLIDGRPLDPRATAGRSVRATLRLFGRICEAVSAAHLRGVMHRDLKPGNILVDSDGAPHILDFGLAKLDPRYQLPVISCQEGEVRSSSIPADNRQLTTDNCTHTGQFVGSLPWCSPEQAAGGELDIRTDVYSLGVLLYQMLTGVFPYPITGSVGDVLQRVRTDAPLRPRAARREIDDEVETILLKCLQKEPRRRYQSAGELARDLSHYLAGEPIEAKRDSAAYVLRKTLRRHRGVTGVAAAFALVTTVGFILSFTFWQQARRDRDRAAGEAKRAEDALAREAEQRRLADQVSNFQGRMLEEIDVERMGRGMLLGLRDQVKAGLEREFVGEGAGRRKRTAAEVEAELARFDAVTSPANPMDVARRVMDEHVLKPAGEALEKEFADQPLVQARIHNAIGMNYLALGLYDAAEPHLRSALEIRQRELGAEHEMVAQSLNNLAGLLQEKGDYAAAEPLFRDALELRRKLLGDDDPDVAGSLNNLGGLAQAAGDHAAAESFFREALALNRKLLGDDHPLVAIGLNNLAESLRARRDYVAAEPLYREALALSRKLGDERPVVASCLGNLGVLLKSKGDMEAAELLHREALELTRKLQGDEHPDVATRMNNLALVLLDKRDYAAAEPLFRESLARSRKLGEEHPNVALVMNSLAGLLLTKGDFGSAEPLFREALARFRNSLGDEHPDVECCLVSLSLSLKGLGDYAAAEPPLREALALRRKRLGDDHPQVATTLNILGKLLAKQGDYAEAEAAHREARAIYAEDSAGDNLNVGLSLWYMAVAQQAQGKLDEAEPAYHESLALYRKLLGEENYDVAEILLALGTVRQARGDFPDAEHWLTDAESMSRKVLGDAHQTTRASVTALIGLYEEWHAADPSGGCAMKAAESRARLDQMQSSTRAADGR